MRNRRALLQGLVAASASLALRPSEVNAGQRALPVALTADKKRKARLVGRNLVRAKSLAFGELDQLVSKTAKGDIMSTLFSVFRESIEKTNEDKRAFLSKLKGMNDIAKALNDYLGTLVDVLDDLEDVMDDDGTCSPTCAVDATKRLEQSRSNLTARIRKSGTKAKNAPHVRALLTSLERDRRILAKTKKVYSSLPQSKGKKK